MDNKKIGELIARLRKEKGLTQRELGEKVHVGSRAVSKWECGVTIPDISIINELSEILGISSRELLSGETLTKPQPTKTKKKIPTKIKPLLTVIPILIIITVAILIYFNNKTYVYNMMTVDHQKFKVDGYVTYKHGTIELHINEIKFNEYETIISKIRNYQYYIKLGNETIVGYGQTKEDNNSYKNYTISDVEEVLKINYFGNTNLTRKKLLNETISILLTIIDENDNKSYYEYKISLYKKAR